MFVDEYAVVATLLIVILISFASSWVARTLQENCAGKALEQKSPEEYQDFVESLADENYIAKDTQSSAEVTGDSLTTYKTLYHKMQSLEQHPDIIQESWSTLISFLDEAVASALQSPESGILSLKVYSKATASAYLQREEAAISEEWEQYLSRRRAGSPRELFRTRDEAIAWLKAAAPVKFVDGAWLGHVHNITTPFPLRHVTKDAWQVMSEELGDGDVEKNHVHLFSRLLDNIGVHLPRGDSVGFAHQSLGLDDIHRWKAGLAQLLISLFPHDFLPEILGFNLQFELITLQTFKASVELAELKIDPYYFVLHITIDNSDSGHSAIALQTVNKYIEHKRRTEGDKAAHQAWKRVQTGYILSDFFGKAHTEGIREPAELEADVRRIFKSKTREARKYHRNSRLKIGRHTLTDWLQPDRWESSRHQRDFLLDLSSSRSWIHRGDGKASRFIKELEWGGKMFGVFTQRETRALERWIDSQTDGYWSFVGRDGRQERFQKRDIRTDYPVLLPSSPLVHRQDTHLPKAPHPFHPYRNHTPPPKTNKKKTQTTTKKKKNKKKKKHGRPPPSLVHPTLPPRNSHHRPGQNDHPNRRRHRAPPPRPIRFPYRTLRRRRHGRSASDRQHRHRRAGFRDGGTERATSTGVREGGAGVVAQRLRRVHAACGHEAHRAYQHPDRIDVGVRGAA